MSIESSAKIESSDGDAFEPRNSAIRAISVVGEATSDS